MLGHQHTFKGAARTYMKTRAKLYLGVVVRNSPLPTGHEHALRSRRKLMPVLAAHYRHMFVLCDTCDGGEGIETSAQEKRKWNEKLLMRDDMSIHQRSWIAEGRLTLLQLAGTRWLLALGLFYDRGSAAIRWVGTSRKHPPENNACAVSGFHLVVRLQLSNGQRCVLMASMFLFL